MFVVIIICYVYFVWPDYRDLHAEELPRQLANDLGPLSLVQGHVRVGTTVTLFRHMRA